MRCPNCHKFAAFAEPEGEVNNEQIDNGEITAEVVVTVNSECCGEPLKQCQEPTPKGGGLVKPLT